MKKNIKIVVVVIVILIILFIIVSSSKRGNPGNNQGAEGLDQEQSEVVDSNRYVNKDLGYSFLIPDGWKETSAFSNHEINKNNDALVLVKTGVVDSELESSQAIENTIIIQPLSSSKFVDLFSNQEVLNVDTFLKGDLGVIHMVHTTAKDPNKTRKATDEGYVIKYGNENDIIVQSFYEKELGGELKVITDFIINSFDRSVSESVKMESKTIEESMPTEEDSTTTVDVITETKDSE